MTECYLVILDTSIPLWPHGESWWRWRGSWAVWRDGLLILSGEKVFHVTQQHLHRAVTGGALTAPERNRPSRPPAGRAGFDTKLIGWGRWKYGEGTSGLHVGFHLPLPHQQSWLLPASLSFPTPSQISSVALSFPDSQNLNLPTLLPKVKTEITLDVKAIST